MKIVGGVFSENWRGAPALVWHVEWQMIDCSNRLLLTVCTILIWEAAASATARHLAAGQRELNAKDEVG
jgi:hypothetical protein